MALLPMPFNNPRTYAGHGGVDFPQSRGKVIPASGPGVVYHRNTTPRGGNQIWVRYDLNGKEVGYAHMDSFNGCPAVGTRVSAGTRLGYVGSLGQNSTGPHLHIEINGDVGTAGVWRAFDKSRVVGAAPAGGGGGSVSGWNQTSRPTKDIQRLVGTTADGQHGPKTDAAIKAWQKRNRLTADGIWGVISDAVGFPIGVDGDPGVRTIAKLQHRVGATIDGQDGPDTNRHLQRALGVVVDGQRGPDTIRALQKAVGATVDGQEGPDTWRKVQSFLNTGKPFPKITAPTPTPLPEQPKLDPAAPWKSQPVDYKGAVWIGSPNYNNGAAPARTKDKIVLHWFGSDSSLAGTDAHFQNPETIKNGRGTGASSQYGIGRTGTVHQYVREVDYAHTNGHTDANATSITIEHEGGPGKPVTDATYDASIRLVADIARRIGITELAWEENIFPHKFFVATQCPGTLDHGRIIRGANAILRPTPPTEPAPGTVNVAKAELVALRSQLEAAQKNLGAAAATVTGWLS